MWRRHRALAEDDFWNLIAVLDGRTDDDATERLSEALRGRGPKIARAFQERLAKALYDLDGEDFASLLVRWTDEDEDEEPIPLSDDSFLYLRAAVVARGRDIYQEILTDPRAALRYRWDDGESLLYVADEFTGDDCETRYSYETGANENRWPPRQHQTLPWGDGPCPVLIEIRNLLDPLTVQTSVHHVHPDPTGTDADRDAASEDSEDSEDSKDRTVYLPPRYLRHDLPEDLGSRLAQILLDVGGIPDQVGAPVIAVTLDVADAFQAVPTVGEPTTWPDPFGVGLVDDDTPQVRPVRIAVPDALLRSLSRDAREAMVAALVAACLLAVLPDHHPARPVLEQLRCEGAAHLSPPEPT